MMRKAALVLGFNLAVAGAASAAEPTLSAGGGGLNVLNTGRDTYWSEPPNLDGLIASSEIIGSLGLESEIANDFVLTSDATIGYFWWWGGYYNGSGCGEIGYGTHWNLRIYDDGGCVPLNVLSESIAVFADEMFVYCQAGTYPVFQYIAPSNCTNVIGGNLYWFSVQACDHGFPPQVGRLASAAVTNCTSVFRSAYFGYPDWTSAFDVFGEDVDFSQEIQWICTTPVVKTTWGAVKALYR